MPLKLNFDIQTTLTQQKLGKHFAKIQPNFTKLEFGKAKPTSARVVFTTETVSDALAIIKHLNKLGRVSCKIDGTITLPGPPVKVEDRPLKGSDPIASLGLPASLVKVLVERNDLWNLHTIRDLTKLTYRELSTQLSYIGKFKADKVVAALGEHNFFLKEE